MAQHEDLVIPSHLGRPLATCMHYPLCAVVAQPGIEHEVSSCYFVLWDVNTRLIKQQFKVEVGQASWFGSRFGLWQYAPVVHQSMCISSQRKV
ncbi:hypothetical protein CBOM_02615 [Ceraceosorus bombacis]|uniref:Uncharacterized protein n=1 Tax=Ceraceosorus bombacis TaxID=401625 RepID=A0A0N7L9U9_9BASI|nr:hypothetical protein CBOM_02615 [Ceraceosorus bombacis]